jgi:hypothetical protein
MGWGGLAVEKRDPPDPDITRVVPEPRAAVGQELTPPKRRRLRKPTLRQKHSQEGAAEPLAEKISA